MAKHGIELPDHELVCVPFSSPEYQDYFHAMCAAANFAWCNQVIYLPGMLRYRNCNVFGKSGGELTMYDVAQHRQVRRTRR